MNQITTEQDVTTPTEPCACRKPSQPCGIIIFGASGDLTARKLMPALYRLYSNNFLPEHFYILGCARTENDHARFRAMMNGASAAGSPSDDAVWKSFVEHLYYCSLQYDDPAGYRSLAAMIEDLDSGHDTSGNRLFYLAIPPFLYKPVSSMIGASGLAGESENGRGWARIVIEKPFGTDLTSAVALNETLHESVEEHQIYRIDHYLAKETIQNIQVFRFANAIFEPIWNRQHIEYVDICAAEQVGVGHRAGYYENAGILRDMFQNHMMQLMALVAMEPPPQFSSEMIRNEKAKLLQSIRPFDETALENNILLGQYGPGSIDGREVPGYRQEQGVAPDSLTPTYALMKVYIDNLRWHGVPFYLMSGKRLARKQTRISIQFRDVAHSIFKDVIRAPIPANRLNFDIQPRERISLSFQAKRPGASVCLRSISMDFRYDDPAGDADMDAYEKVLLDCMTGEQMLFLRQDSEELCWSFLTPLIEGCESCACKENMLRFYSAGTWGPDGIDTLRHSSLAP